jgi:hypothetical protein
MAGDDVICANVYVGRDVSYGVSAFEGEWLKVMEHSQLC